MDLTTIRPGERRTIESDIRTEAAARAGEEAKRAREMAGESGVAMRHRLGESMLDLMDEYFPEEMAARRRQDVVRAFAAGVVVGFAGRELLRRR